MRKVHHQTIDSLKGKYRNERLFILGTGPSLLEADLDKLSREFTFGVNFIMQVPGMFEPTFLGSSEQLGLAEILPQIPNGSTLKFIAHTYDLTIHPTYEEHLTDWTWLYTHPARSVASGDVNGFGEELDWVGQSYSTVFTCAVQLGIWMGFDPIYLVGCDNSGSHHAYDDESVALKYKASVSEDVPDEESRHRALQMAASASVRVMGEHGRRLYDLSPVGGLHIPRQLLGDVL